MTLTPTPRRTTHVAFDCGAAVEATALCVEDVIATHVRYCPMCPPDDPHSVRRDSVWEAQVMAALARLGDAA